MSQPEVIGRECRHVIHVHSSADSVSDLHYVKEIIHVKEGDVVKQVPNIRALKDYQRDFYITKEGHRKHKDKKEAEDLHKLQKYSSNDRQMPYKIARLLGRNVERARVRQLAQSPYLYGADIHAATLIKQKYMQKWPDAISPATVAVYDIETDVVEGHEEILMASVTYGSKAILAVSQRFLKGIDNPEEQIQKAFQLYLGEGSEHNYVKERNLKLEVVIVAHEGLVVSECMKRAHEWKPDWMVVWNISFDLPKSFKALEANGMSVAEVFCDPDLPPEFKNCNWRQGTAQKVTASGRTMVLSPHEQWHVFEVPSSFYWIDAMVVYAMIRKANGQEPSYSLDYTLNKNLGIRKLKFTEADHIPSNTIEWHQLMQTKHKLAYCIYNVFDCVSVELLDEKTKDLAMTMPELCGYSRYRDFNSTPKQLADDLHFFYLQENKVITCLSDKMKDENDLLVIGMDGWPVALQCHLMAVPGLDCIKDFKQLRSLLYAFVSDLDVKSSYPYTEIFLNISKATTMLELCYIEGVLESIRRHVGLDVTGGRTNASSFCINIYKAPTNDRLLDLFEKEMAEMDHTREAA